MDTEKLISAVGAEQVIVKALVDCMIKHKGLHEVSDAVLDALHSVPTVEAMPVVHARWESYSSTMMACPECGKHVARHRFDFCPKCGAKMDLEEQ